MKRKRIAFSGELRLNPARRNGNPGLIVEKCNISLQAMDPTSASNVK
jgi:hypothetical protein